MISPSYLQPGDTIAVTAPASTVSKKSLEAGLAILKNRGYKVIIGDTVGKNYHNFSATDNIRLAELQSFINQPEVKCIMAARGGYGTTRILDDLDFSHLINKPKWLVGFSDLTAPIAALNSLGLQAVHGPMLKTLGLDTASCDSLLNVLEGVSNPAYQIKPNSSNKTGKAEGLALGGNLCILSHIIGTKYCPDFKDAILFIEDIGEFSYAIDRYVVHLKRAGILESIAGLVVGDLSDLKETKIPFGKNIKEIILDHCKEYTYPIAFDFSFGHENKNLPIVMGKKIQLSVDTKSCTLTQ
jgi:muramoyltetrapeptide carboxypeptidase